MSAQSNESTNRPRAGFFSPRFQTVVYFNGPMTQWQRFPHHSEIVAIRKFRFKSFAFAFGVASTRQLTNVLFQVVEL
jgi:hypothetical protein